MLSSSLPQRLVRPTFQTARFISSDVAGVASLVTRRDLALEQRRAARLTRESLLRKQSEAAALGIAPDRTYVAKRKDPMSPMVPTSAVIFSTFPAAPKRPRRPLGGGQRSPMAKRGTERSRTQVSIIDPAGSIKNFSAREAAKRAERAAKTQTSKEDEESVDEDEDVTLELPQFMSPEPVTPDLAPVLDRLPNLAPSIPSLPPTTHKKLSPEWLKCTYGGDYSKYQLDTQEYLRGARGVGHLNCIGSFRRLPEDPDPFLWHKERVLFIMKGVHEEHDRPEEV